jgi:hypothetical protein
MNTTDTTLILAGNGFELTIAPEAEYRKEELLCHAASVKRVASNDESADAQWVSRKLAAMRIEVEKSRKLVKEPVNRIGKLIDSTASNFVAEIEAEEKRITKLVGEHAEEVARLKREKEEAERRAFEEARAAREAAEAAAAAAESGKIADVIAAKQAERERQETLAARLAASEAVAGTNVAKGVRFAWDFEVTDIALLYHQRPDLVEMTARRSPILSTLKDMEEHGYTVEKLAATLGIRAFKRPVVSTR